jgi:hypothetical protein
LAWGVVACVHARRGQMPDAIAAINLAGQFTPENRFVAHTASEILAWYDLKADKSELPNNAKDGLTRVRNLVEKQAAFTEAYETARNAYQSQASAAQPPAQTESAAQTPAAPTTAPTISGTYAPQAVWPTDQGEPGDHSFGGGFHGGGFGGGHGGGGHR